MKLSEVIENMIVTGNYGAQNEYMCNVLKEHGYRDFVDDVHDMVAIIHPRGVRGIPLICALHETFIINMNKMSCREMANYTKQLYCWWVFDLKRKGL